MFNIVLAMRTFAKAGAKLVPLSDVIMLSNEYGIN